MRNITLFSIDDDDSYTNTILKDKQKQQRRVKKWCIFPLSLFRSSPTKAVYDDGKICCTSYKKNIYVGHRARFIPKIIICFS